VIDLHDAGLDEIRFDWKLAKLELTFSTANGRAVLRADGATSVGIPRRLPWGPSSQVNKVTVSPHPGVVRVEIEMQSGDTLQVEAKSMVITSEDASRVGPTTSRTYM
jgi:hypothetical protein